MGRGWQQGVKEDDFGGDGVRVHKIGLYGFLKDIQAIDDWKLVEY